MPLSFLYPLALFLLYAVFPSRTTSDDEWIDAAVLICGCGTAEELSEEQSDIFRELCRHPLDLNSCTLNRLLSSGLLGEYRAASLIDYRSRTGDILSWSELSLVDGFNADLVAALRHFAILQSTSPPASGRFPGVDNSLMVRTSLRAPSLREESEWCAGMKYTLDVSSLFSLKWSLRNAYPGSRPELPGTLGIGFDFGRKVPTRVVAGNFQARFGQGLLLWSGSSFSGFSGTGSFGRSGRGVSSTGTYAASCRGIAAEMCFGMWTADAALSLESGGNAFLALSAGRSFSSGHIAANFIADLKNFCGSLDWRYGTGDVSLFGELALECSASRFPVPAAVAGLLWIPRYGCELSALLRYYPPSFGGRYAAAPRSSSVTSDEGGLSACWKSSGTFISVDCCRHPSKNRWRQKFIADRAFPIAVSFGDSLSLEMKPELRASLRYSPSDNPRSRLDLRADLDAGMGALRGHFRYNYLRCEQPAFLLYAELGSAFSAFRIFGRWTLFKVDKWNDRIYSYERDLPGSFSSIAYYGRGWAVSVFSALKFAGSELDLRLGGTFYPWTKPAKPSRLEAKLQYSLRF